MGEVVGINDNKPHISGDAFCDGCGHEWVGVAPSGTIHLTCPECDCGKGMWKNSVVPEEFWKCNCGNSLFFIVEGGCMCKSCGVIQVLD